MYKVKDLKGKIVNGTANLDFLPPKYLEKQKVKTYNFVKFTSGIAEERQHDSILSKITTPKMNTMRHFSDDTVGDVNPVQTDTSNLSFDINNEDAITYTFNGKNKNNNNNANS